MVDEIQKKGWEPTGEIVSSESAKKLAERFGSKVLPCPNPAKEVTIKTDKESIVEVLNFLKNELSFNYLSDLTAVHFPQNEKEITVVYHLFSIENKESLRIKVELKDGESIPSVISIFPAANWMEREAFDLMGVKFEGHPNLKRILLPDEWEGHPLRKEYPLGGTQEEEIRSNRYGVPALLPDDIEEARKIIKEGKNGK